MTITTSCDYCGEPFIATRSDARFCSTTHRTAAHRARHAAEADRRRAHHADIVRRMSETMRRGMALGDLEAVRADLNALEAEAARLLAA